MGNYHDPAVLFHRHVERQHVTVTTPYIPHGSLSVPSGKIFSVHAEVTGPKGTFVNVPNACTT